ncbi:hypothetical protein BOTBODRAFT_183241 [Botryobasidium botryosum FD-172 SS1]|uniref:Fido domain-containing protein n=1 Tax=Botryobasidium botryosum (strain FD-172 SS1) TaxID=930990 RepID=A0A067N9K7_BOTB1|nr:hypothetical protein BOTBODRAFT_183241 [Botryobasidium botryosum FD-172 SS1]
MAEGKTSWESAFQRFLETLNDVGLHEHGLIVLNGTSSVAQLCQQEASKIRIPGRSEGELSGEFKTICELHKALVGTEARADEPRQELGDQVFDPEHVPGTPIWEFLQESCPFQNSLPVGYFYLITHFKLPTLGHHTFTVLNVNTNRSVSIAHADDIKWIVIDDAESSSRDYLYHLDFALSHEGVNLCILWFLFHSDKFSASTFELYILACLQSEERSTAQQMWFWYEFLTGKNLSLPDLGSASEPGPVFLLDPDIYHTPRPIPSPRHGILANQLGNRGFCPVLRKHLSSIPSQELAEKLRSALKQVPDGMVRSVRTTLYAAETTASYEIEYEYPSEDQVRSISQEIETILSDASFAITEDSLCSLNQTFLGNKSPTTYRNFQNWISTAYIPPKPSDVNSLMSSLLSCLDTILDDPFIDPITAATIIAIGFVDIHPFRDGNGRLHRFLLHFILSRKGFYDPGIILPLSKGILDSKEKYFESLRADRKYLMRVIDYTFDPQADTLTVNNPITHPWYRYPDMTATANFLRDALSATIDVHLPREIASAIQLAEALARLSSEAGIDEADGRKFLNKFLPSCGHLVIAQPRHITRRTRER